jgi:deferrochelatase/peroxidase EfeB
VNLPDYNDVQGLARFGYSKLAEASYQLLRIRDAVAARAWIASAPVSSAEYREKAPERALQVAFTPSALRLLGVPESAIATFSAEFIEGMAGEANRSRRLGDTGKNDPLTWLWGGPGKAVDLVVIAYATQRLEAWIQAIQQDPWNDAFEIVTTLSTSDMDGHEPFGFTDGISQPEFDWKREQPTVGTTLVYSNSVALGELLLGYPNEYGNYTDRPLLNPAADPADDLRFAEDDPASKDLGLNGTYLVLRQLEQDVRGFWQYLDCTAEGKPGEQYHLAAALVGRTLEGESLIARSGKNSTGMDKPGATDLNSFTYDSDPAGTQCPFGAHVRRANPRNADLAGHPSGPIARLASRLGIPGPRMHVDLIASTRFHRILRRGREYGPKLSPEDALQPASPNEPPRGLHFACLCANIARQFEFVQNAWLVSTKFNGLRGESDPLLGNRAALGDCPSTDNFSIPRAGKVPRRLTGIPQFVTVRGGAYFFMPSLRALRYFARGGKPN